MRARNLDEAIDAVSKVYCPHTIEVVGRVGDIDAFLEIQHSTFQPLVGLSYSAPVHIDAQNFSRLAFGDSPSVTLRRGRTISAARSGG